MIHTQRKAFSMLTAIVVIVTMAVIAAYVTSTAGKSIKITTDQYRKEQAMLLAKSYTEYAIMAVSANGCLDTITADVDGGITGAGTSNGYYIRTHILYIGDGAHKGSCASDRQLSASVLNPDTPLNIIIDAYVDYKDLNDMNKTLTYHRRSLQKI